MTFADGTATCPECGRVFNLMDERDADEFYNGHDCDPSLVDENGKILDDTVIDFETVDLRIGTHFVDLDEGRRWGYDIYVAGEAMTIGAAVHEAEADAFASGISQAMAYRPF